MLLSIALGSFGLSLAIYRHLSELERAENARRDSHAQAQRIAPAFSLERHALRASLKQSDIDAVKRGDMSTASFIRKWRA